MAGNNTKKGGSRGAGGSVAGGAAATISPAEFKAKSQAASDRAGRMDGRITSRLNKARYESMAFERLSATRGVSRKRYVAYRKAYAGYGTAAFARDQRSGRANANAMANAREARIQQGPTSSRYSAPRTRLY